MAAALATAAATLGASYLASRAASKGSAAQERSAQQALQFEREREATRRSEYDRSMADYRRQWDAFQRFKLGLMNRYGGGRLTLGRLGGMETPDSTALVPRRRMTLGDF